MFSFLNNIPQVTKNFLIINVLMYVVMQIFIMNGGPDLTRILSSHYVLSPLFEPYQSISHMFMHSALDISHIFFNMFWLVIFGGHVERIWGPKRYFLFYFIAGIGAFVLDNIVNGMEMVSLQNQLTGMNVNVESLRNLASQYDRTFPNELNEAFGKIVHTQEQADVASKYLRLCLMNGIGASGAIFGLLAAFAILFPNTELYLMFIPIPIKAKYLIGVYVLYELYQVFSGSADNVNHLAHLGGALTGTILVLIWNKKDRNNFY